MKSLSVKIRPLTVDIRLATPNLSFTWNGNHYDVQAVRDSVTSWSLSSSSSSWSSLSSSLSSSSSSDTVNRKKLSCWMNKNVDFGFYPFKWVDTIVADSSHFPVTWVWRGCDAGVMQCDNDNLNRNKTFRILAFYSAHVRFDSHIWLSLSHSHYRSLSSFLPFSLSHSLSYLLSFSSFDFISSLFLPHNLTLSTFHSLPLHVSSQTSLFLPLSLASISTLIHSSMYLFSPSLFCQFLSLPSYFTLSLLSHSLFSSRTSLNNFFRFLWGQIDRGRT